jgi:outer membrane protein assembly factor BamA
MRVAIAIAVLGLGCAGRQHKQTDDRLASIQFEGNKALSHGTLVAGLALHRAQANDRALDPYLVPVDAERIRGRYLRLGYLDVDVRSRVDRKDNSATVTYTIEEGPRAQTKVVIDGLPAGVSQTDVRAKLPLADGAPFDYEKYDAAKEPMLTAVKDAGYAHARLDADVFADRANHQAIVELHFDPGPLCHFGAVEIVGAQGDLAGAITARVAFDKGDKYSNAAISKTQLALYGMKRFSTVRIDPQIEGTSDEIPVKISVSESSAHELKLGGGAGIDPVVYEIRGRAAYTVVGWPWPLTTFDADLRPAYAFLRDGTGNEPRVRALARLSRMDLFMTNLTGELEVGYEYLIVEAYTNFGPRARVGIRTPIVSDRFQLRAGYQIQHYDFIHISTAIDPATAMQLGLTTPEQLGTFDQVVSADLRDNRTEPRLGAYFEVRAAEGARWLGGTEQYLQVTPEAAGYVPLGPVVLAGRFRYGQIFGDVPPTERYYSGGVSSQRGFAERRLSPFVVGEVNGSLVQVPVGGATLVDTNVETRFPIGTIHGLDLGGVVFLDGGDVTETASELNFGNLNWAIGGGLRLKTVVGPVRFDVGYRLNRTGLGNPDPGQHFAFHLSLGEAF